MCLTIRIVFGDNELPFQCPNSPPEILASSPSEAGEAGVGLKTTLYEEGMLDGNDSEVYNDYRAALALVPCDAKPITVFTNDLVAGDYTISVIYLYDKPVERLKKWLR